MNPNAHITAWTADSDPILTVEAECRNCHKFRTYTVRESKWIAWVTGALIQNVMPEMPKEDRELLISGTCAKCFQEMFEAQ